MKVKLTFACGMVVITTAHNAKAWVRIFGMASVEVV